MQEVRELSTVEKIRREDDVDDEVVVATIGMECIHSSRYVARTDTTK
jgi:hypothetical protein